MKILDEFYYLEFYEHLNNTFISLIYKNKIVKELRDLRPISLLSSVYNYKITSKLLAVWLKPVTNGIIFPP